MTRLVLPQMLKRKKGVVLNVGSGAGVMLPATPLLAVYAASKVKAAIESQITMKYHHFSLFRHLSISFRRAVRSSTKNKAFFSRIRHL